jgi:hypothetical protein
MSRAGYVSGVVLAAVGLQAGAALPAQPPAVPFTVRLLTSVVPGATIIIGAGLLACIPPFKKKGQ